MSGWWAVSFVGLWLIVLALIAIVFALARQIGVLHLRLGPRGALEIDTEGPPLGDVPPPIAGVDLDGRTHDLTAPGVERFLLFVSPSCPICAEILPSIPVVARRGLAAVLIATGDPAPYARWGVPVVRDDGISQRFGVPGTPYAIVLDDRAVVRAKGTINTLEQVEGLVDTARSRALAEPHGLSSP